MSSVESPCIGICTLDAESVCTGCGRTLAEIAEWSQASEDRKRHVVEQAALRRARINPPNRPTA